MYSREVFALPGIKPGFAVAGNLFSACRLKSNRQAACFRLPKLTKRFSMNRFKVICGGLFEGNSEGLLEGFNIKACEARQLRPMRASARILPKQSEGSPARKGYIRYLLGYARENFLCFLRLNGLGLHVLPFQ